MISIRPFDPADWDALLDLANAAVPFAPQENAQWLAYRRAFDESRQFRRHFLALDGDRPVGYGCLEQQGDDPARLRIFVVCSPTDLQGEVGRLLYDRLLLAARSLGATRLWAREFQEDEPIRAFFTGRGFVETQRLTLPDQRPMVVFTLTL